MNGNQATLMRAFAEAAVTKRWHTCETLKEDLVGRHSWGVAMFVIVFCDRAVRPELIFACLTHDMHERWSGDSPSPARRAIPALQEGEDAAEWRFWSWAGSGVLAFDDDAHSSLEYWERVWLKLGDAVDAAWYAKREMQMGNTLMANPYSGCLRGVEAIIADNADLFVDPDGLKEAAFEYINAQRLPESLTDLEKL